MPYNEPPTFVDGGPWGEDEANLYIRDNFAHLTRKIGARVRRTTNLGVDGNAPDITYNVEVEDTDGFYHGGLPQLFQVPVGFQGIYTVQFYANWTAAPGANNVAIIRKNNNAMVRQTAPATQFSSVTLSYTGYLAQGDQITTALYNAAGAVTVTPISPTGAPTNDPGSPEMWMYRV